MRNTKKCPKCQNDVMLEISTKTFGKISGAFNSIRLGGYPSNKNSVFVGRYICKECGYSEEWIDKADIVRIENSLAGDVTVQKDQNFVQNMLASLGIGLSCLVIAGIFFLCMLLLFIIATQNGSV